MKKDKLLSGKRLWMIFSVFIAAFASTQAWAQVASEYCRTPFGTGTSRALFTWNTEPNGDVTIKIFSGIEGEAAGLTTFRGQGWADTRFLTLAVSTDGGETYVANAGNQWFTKTLSADLSTITLTPAQDIPQGAKIRYNNTTEYKTSLDGNAYSNYTFVFTYGSTKQCPDPSPLPVPTNVAINAATGALTFDAVENASSYTASLYAGSILYYTEPNVTSGTVLSYTDPGVYTVKVKAVGDDLLYLNSLESEAAEWTIAGEAPAIGDSEYCYVYWNPSGGGSNADDSDAVVMTWETQENGTITVTLGSVKGNNATFRNAGMNAANFRFGPFNAAGNLYVTTAAAGNVCTVTPREGVVLPQGMSIRYQGNVEFAVATNNDLYPAGNFTYTYGSNCAALERTKLGTPTEVAVDEDGILTFEGVEDAGAYDAYVYLGENMVHLQAGVVSGDPLNFMFPGTFDVKVVATPDVTQLAVYEESDFSEGYAWTVNYEVPATIAQSVYCDYEVNPNGGGNSIPNNNAEWGDHDISYWSWTTDADGQIVVSIDRAKIEDYTPTVRFRSNGMVLSGLRINGIRGDLLLEKVGDNLGKTQTFKPKAGITLLPGLEITYSGQTTYLMLETKPEGSPGAIQDLYPALTFATPYIYGSNCEGEATVLGIPANLSVADNALAFDAVDNASSYKLYIYDASGANVHTQAYAANGAITYTIPGHYTLKVQAIGNAAEYINSELSEAVAWDLTAKLATPVISKINTENKVSFAPVAAAVSYTLTIYDAADATVALETIPEFEAGSPIDMGAANYGTTYYVRVQAIGDDDVILDSDLSAPFTWEFNEPFVCNLLLEDSHLLVAGSADRSYTKPNGDVQNTAPYFAPGWAPNYNYTFDVTDNVVSIHLGAATGANWQAQFRFLPDKPVILQEGETYEIKARVKVSKETSIESKIAEYNDNDVFIPFIPRQVLAASETGTVFGGDVIVPPAGLKRIYQFLFDFGPNPADIDIEISEIVICGVEGEDVAIDLVAVETLSVYPVPAKDILYVSGIGAATQVSILDLTGRTVDMPAVAQGSIDVSGLAKGVYILSANGSSAKFIKE